VAGNLFTGLEAAQLQYQNRYVSTYKPCSNNEFTTLPSEMQWVLWGGASPARCSEQSEVVGDVVVFSIAQRSYPLQAFCFSVKITRWVNSLLVAYWARSFTMYFPVCNTIEQLICQARRDPFKSY
jgi:hypothetical protein